MSPAEAGTPAGRAGTGVGEAREVDAAQAGPERPPVLWRPKRVLVTRTAWAEHPHAREVVDRCRAAGVEDVQVLPADRLTGLRGEDERGTYVSAKSTLAVVVAPPGKLRLQPIPPSADWRLDLAEGCPAHCQYCYLAGSLSGPPVTRVYANLPEVLARVPEHEGRGGVTSTDAARVGEGTTFEASCYTDPLGLEHLTGSLAAAVRWFGTRPASSLRFTTKFDGVEPLLGLPHGRRTRVRMSVNADEPARRFEGGTARVPQRLGALRRLADDGYRVGLTIAPIMPVPGWREQYGDLLDAAAEALSGAADTDLTVECITHRFTPGSKKVLEGWYPRTRLEMDEDLRTQKRNKFGGVKHVYPREVMAELRGWFTEQLEVRLPAARLLYWT